MVVLIVVPGEELVKPTGHVGQRREPIRKVGLVFRRLEVTFHEGAVIAHRRSTEALFDGKARE